MYNACIIFLKAPSSNAKVCCHLRMLKKYCQIQWFCVNAFKCVQFCTTIQMKTKKNEQIRWYLLNTLHIYVSFVGNMILFKLEFYTNLDTTLLPSPLPFTVNSNTYPFFSLILTCNGPLKKWPLAKISIFGGHVPALKVYICR